MKALQFTRRHTVHPDETERAKRAFRADQFRQDLLLSEPVLQCHHHRRWLEQRRQQVGQGRVGGCLQRHQDHIDWSDRRRIRFGPDGCDAPPAGFLLYIDPIALADRGEIAAQQETNIGSEAGKACTVIEANCAGAHDGNAGGGKRHHRASVANYPDLIEPGRR